MPKNDEYTINLTVNGKDFMAFGSTPEEAMATLELPKPTTRGVIFLQKDGKKSNTMPLNILQIRKLSLPGLTGDIQRTVIRKHLIL